MVSLTFVIKLYFPSDTFEDQLIRLDWCLDVLHGVKSDFISIYARLKSVAIELSVV